MTEHTDELLRVAIVGGGAAGIFAALGARSEIAGRADASIGLPKFQITIFERNPRLGIKILISGGGKCNITHDAAPKVLANKGFLVTAEKRFLSFALHEYPAERVLELLTRQSVPYHARENGRIFPDSANAEDVLAAFERELQSANIEVRTESRITELSQSGAHWKLGIRGISYQCDALILATGGISYSKVGTTGDGIGMARESGHAIEPLMSALAPIYLEPQPPVELQGVALREITLVAVGANDERNRRTGDLLFTHRGISGPAALDLSREAARMMRKGSVRLEVALMSEQGKSLSEQGIAAGLQRLQSERPNQQVRTWLEELLPNRFAPFVLNQAELPLDQKWNQLSKFGRAMLAKTLAGYELGTVAEIPIERGEVTAGGVTLSEVDSKTMQSKLHPNLFFAGEMLDVAGEIGGFNLQAAYSTGWLAGRSAVRSLLGKTL